MSNPDITILTETPLTLIAKLPDGCDEGKMEAAQATAIIIEEVHLAYPNHKFQIIPFSYIQYQHRGVMKSALSSFMMVGI